MHATPLHPSRYRSRCLSIARNGGLILSFAVICNLTPAAVAISAERDAARLAGDGDVTFFLTWFGGTGLAALVATIFLGRLGASLWRRQQEAAGPRRDEIELSIAACIAISLAIVCGALALSIAIAWTGASLIGLFATSTEFGPLEWFHFILWLSAAGIALLSTFRSRDRDTRALMMLLAAGALFIAARESDLHVKLNSDSLGYWGVHYRRDWWVSSETPVLPRVVWGVVGVVILVVGGWLAWRCAISIFVRGARQGRLVWILAASAAYVVGGYVLDDGFRYRPGINLRQSQVCEETLETAASIVYAAAIVWGIKLDRRAA